MQKCIWAQHVCYVNPHAEAVKWSHFFRNSCLGKESNSPSSDPLEISSLQWLSISILHLFSLEGNSNVSKALSPPFCKSTYFSTLCMYMQGWTRGIFRSCFAAKPNFSTWRRETLHSREKWTFLILLPWASDMLEGPQPHTHQLQLFLPSGCGTGRRALSFAVLLSVKGACKAFWFQLLFLPLWPLSIFIKSWAGVLIVQPTDLQFTWGWDCTSREQKHFRKGKFFPPEQLLEWKQWPNSL